MRTRCALSESARATNETVTRAMNPFSFIEHASGSIVQYPALALLIALAGGILSTST